MSDLPRIVLVDPDQAARDELSRELVARGYGVEAFADAAAGAEAALAEPPRAMVANLWMPSISGVQLCRLMRAEAGTANLPVILRGPDDDPRSRFWAQRAGAVAYVAKGGMPELLSTLRKVVEDAAAASDGFFLQLSGGSLDIRDRIARHLDTALFDSVIAAEVRALATAGSFPRLFEMLTEFLSQVVTYRWMAVYTREPSQFAMHQRPSSDVHAEVDARIALKVPSCIDPLRLENEAARAAESAAQPLIVCNIPFGTQLLGRIAIAPVGETDSRALLELVGRELGGPLRMAALMDESQRLATTDPLTGLSNRRALLDRLQAEVAHSRRHGPPLTVCLLDVDHFKSINDNYGHAAGDQVLAAIGALLPHQLRIPDVPARWGGEEFVVLLKQCDSTGGLIAAERIRKAITELHIDIGGKSLDLTASFGVAELAPSDNAESVIERADRAMYRAKTGGRNRVELEPVPDEEPSPSRVRITGVPPSSKTALS